MRVPFGLKRTCDTWSVCPPRTASNCPVRPSQSRAVWSNEAVTTRLPSGLKAAVNDLILVSGEDGQQPAGGRVPEARRVIRVNAPGNQPRPVRAEKHRTDMGRVAAQHGDFFAALAIPEVNGVGIDGGRGRNPLAIRTVSQVTTVFA